MRRGNPFLVSRRLDKPQGHRIHTISKAGGPRPVIEDVAQMRIAAPARNRCPGDPKEMVSRFLDILFGERRPKAGPASARLKLGLRAEESRVAADATEETPLVQIPIGPGKGHLRSSLPGDLKRGTAELLSPS